MTGAQRPTTDAGDLGLRPLTARSVVLSTLLGSHPPRLPVRSLVQVGGLFGIAEGTVRVALSRMLADGDLVQSAGRYELSPRLVERQRRQDRSRLPAIRPWSGGWELAVAAPRDATGRATLGRALGDLHLAELREGVWLRPDNLDRELPDDAGPDVRWFRTGPVGDAGSLARSLWDLAGWSGRAAELLDAMRQQRDPAQRFTLSAAVVRHLGSDPLLPDPLLPDGWPGEDLRREYQRFEEELAALLRAPAPAGG